VVSGVVEASQGSVEPGPAPIDARLQLHSVVEPLAQRVASSRQRHLPNTDETS